MTPYSLNFDNLYLDPKSNIHIHLYFGIQFDKLLHSLVNCNVRHLKWRPFGILLAFRHTGRQQHNRNFAFLQTSLSPNNNKAGQSKLPSSAVIGWNICESTKFQSFCWSLVCRNAWRKPNGLDLNRIQNSLFHNQSSHLKLLTQLKLRQKRRGF